MKMKIKMKMKMKMKMKHHQAVKTKIHSPHAKLRDQDDVGDFNGVENEIFHRLC